MLKIRKFYLPKALLAVFLIFSVAQLPEFVSAAQNASLTDNCLGRLHDERETKARKNACVGIILEPFFTPHNSKTLLDGASITKGSQVMVYAPGEVKARQSKLESYVTIHYADFVLLRKQHQLFLHSIKYFRPVLDPDIGILEPFDWHSYFLHERPICLVTMDEKGDGYMYISANNVDRDRRCFKRLFRSFMETELDEIENFIGDRW